MSEIPGITPQVAAFAQRVVQAGYTVFMPLLFGEPMRPPERGYALRIIAKSCISKEFRVLAANESSPIVDWLRALARHAHAECGGRGVGAIGMCFTGNFALAMMLDAPVLAPVLSQPSLPFAITKSRRGGLHASAEELQAAHEKIDNHGARILALRFIQDPMCPGERFARLRDEFGLGIRSDRDRREIRQSPILQAGAQRADESSHRRGRTADPGSAGPHSVLGTAFSRSSSLSESAARANRSWWWKPDRRHPAARSARRPGWLPR